MSKRMTKQPFKDKLTEKIFHFFLKLQAYEICYKISPQLFKAWIND